MPELKKKPIFLFERFFFYLFQYLFFAMFLSLGDKSRRRIINLVQNLPSNDVESHVLSDAMIIGRYGFFRVRNDVDIKFHLVK